MAADTTETVAEHSARLQPSINLHAPVRAYMFSCSSTQIECTTLGTRAAERIHVPSTPER